ncbi:hypothetical protein ACS0TY_026899 [Phlomoides rotata]
MTALEVPITTNEVKVNDLAQGLQDGDFFRSLAKCPSKTFDELLDRADKYINLEEARGIKKIEEKRSAPKKEGEKKKVSTEKAKEVKKGRGDSPGSEFPYSAKRGPQNPKLSGGVCEEKKSNKRKDDANRGKEVREPPQKDGHSHKMGYIQMIVGGQLDGDSHIARKASLRDIHSRNMHEVQEIGDETWYSNVHFGPKEEGEILKPHNVALVITVEIGRSRSTKAGSKPNRGSRSSSSAGV